MAILVLNDHIDNIIRDAAEKGESFACRKYHISMRKLSLIRQSVRLRRKKMKIYQQTDSQGFHIGTSAYDEWVEDKGAYDVDAPKYDSTTHRARFDKDTRTWDIRTREEWDAVLNPPEDDAEE